MVAHPVMDWLAAGVPLALLIDLAGNEAPDSGEILRTEKAGPALPGVSEASRRLVDGMAAY
ncbi:MAG: hypothetical protein QOC60_1616 [Frankiaceae bacterium]|nr:hypothetical protein [Frankiaceae bacterium]